MTRDSSVFSNPAIVYGLTWLTVFMLYAAQLSYQIIYNLSDHIAIIGSIAVPFYIAYFFVLFIASLIRALAGHHIETCYEISEDRVWQSIKWLLIAWTTLTFIEVLFSGGIPIIWFVIGSSKTHFDFGVPTLHGFVNSLLMSSGLLAHYLYITKSPKKIYLIITVSCLIWGVIAMSRNLIIVSLMQYIFLGLQFRKVRFLSLIRYFILLMLLIVGFGSMGDLRSGGDNLIRNLARPVESIPDWVPTGALWGYIYLSTPLNNLFNTTELARFDGDYNFTSTTAQLFPTVIRNAFFDASTLVKGELVDENLNVSTAFVDPYKDMGILGIIIYSLLIGFIGGLFQSRRTSPYTSLARSFFNQCIFFSVFYNHFLMLPLLMQLVWFKIATRGIRL